MFFLARWVNNLYDLSLHLLMCLPRHIILSQKGQGEELLRNFEVVMDKIGVFFFFNFSVAMEVAMLVLKIFE